MSKSIYLSPSTQEKNRGIGGYGTEESRMNSIANITERVLKQHDVVVYRNKPEMTLTQVVADSNSKKPDIHLAIHSNACDGRARGCEVYCHKYGGEGEKLAKEVYSEIALLTPSADKGVKEGCNHYGIGKPLYETAKTNAPAALIEIAFHDSAEDANWIVYNIEEIGTALAKGVLKYFEILYVPETDGLGQAVKLLHEKGIILEPDYWLENSVKGKTINGDYAAILIKKAAEMLKNDSEKQT